MASAKSEASQLSGSETDSLKAVRWEVDPCTESVYSKIPHGVSTRW